VSIRRLWRTADRAAAHIIPSHDFGDLPISGRQIASTFGFICRMGRRNLLAIIEKRIFLNGRPTGIAVGRREMDQSIGYGGRRSRTGIRSPPGETPAK